MMVFMVKVYVGGTVQTFPAIAAHCMDPWNAAIDAYGVGAVVTVTPL